MPYRKPYLTTFTTLILTFAQSTANLAILFQTSQVLAQTPQDRKAEAERLYQQGNKQIQTSQYKEALQSFQQALAIYREIKDRKGEAFSLNYIAIVKRTLGQYPQALEFYKQALYIFREIGDRLNEGTVLNNIGKIYEDLGQYPQALEFYQQALTIRRQVGDRSGEAFTLTDLGSINISLGQYPQALKFYKQSLDIFKKIGDQRQQALTLNAIGIYYRTIDEYPKALGFYQQALNIFREIGERRGEGTSLNNIGDFRRNQGEYSQAQELFQQALNIFIIIGDKVGEGVALSNIGRVYVHQSQYPQALKFFGQALAIFKEVGNKAGEARTLRYIGSVFYQSGNFAEAEKNFRNGMEVLESLRIKLSDGNKVSIFETQTATYQLLQKVLIVQNKTSDALEISERGRSRAFVELLTSRLSSKSTGQTSERLVNKPTIPFLQQIAKQQNATLVEYSIIGDNFKIEGKQKSKESELYIWVIKPTGEVTFRKADLKPLWQKENTDIAKLVTTSRQSIGVTGRGGVLVSGEPDAPKAKQRFRRLHELLIAPIADLLPKKESEKVVFIPQSQLFLVPFPALEDDKGKYLIEKHTILIAPSIQVLDLTHQQRVKSWESGVGKQEVLVVGNPTMPKIPITNEKLIPLPGAEFEAIQIADLFKTQAITGSKATKTAIVQKMSKARIIHFATHGLLDDFKGFGVPGAIALAPSGQDDGFLTSGEILDMKLNADLVVLSACNTGGGNITGDGVIGLSRSLITAGVSSVIVSLWSVNDKSTAFLMSEFYRNLQQNPDKAVALRQAMLTTKKQYSNPLDWAAFTLIGESD
ncbi:MAG: CHAT domain-containing tetratricopeptide repeat protein [Nostoc sp.]|uniref:CHAT domain-containing protein n=1 Tax=Nostoc sp. TaxID=1180 RepID=UPI002FFD1AE6